MIRVKTFFQSLVQHMFISRLEEIPFIIFISFLGTFLTSRVYILLTHKDILEGGIFLEAVVIRGIHVHHLNFGIILMAIAGFVALYDLRPSTHRIIAVLYGIGLGLTFDEFALLLLLQDHQYWARVTYDAIMIISLIFLNIIYFPSFWKARGRDILKLVRMFRSILSSWMRK